jgi:hypothetical protein
MTKTPTVLLLLGVLAWSQPSIASSSPSTSARIGVGASVVRSCGVTHEPSAIGIRCTRGTTDRVVVATPEPRIVALERDGAVMSADIDTVADGTVESEHVLTLQF